MPYLLFMSCGIMWTLISFPPQMAERLRRAQPISVTNHVTARQSLIERAVTWLATESGWTRGKRSAICSGKLCGGFIIFEQCCPCGHDMLVLRVHRRWLVMRHWWTSSSLSMALNLHSLSLRNTSSCLITPPLYVTHIFHVFWLKFYRCTLCPEKETRMFFIISSTKFRRFW